MDDLRSLAESFRARLQAARSRAREDFEWYPHDTLANLLAIERLAGSDSERLLGLADGKPILDVGCADGELAFFLETLGCEVHAIDNPVTNFNGMLGVRALGDDLQSSVLVSSTDLDAQFALPATEYGVVLVLGLLYHLKNPFYVMEKLSKHARYCFVSTSITEYVPGLFENVAGTAIAYLADVYDVNRDSTNYWFFSEAGFRRLLTRANWEIVSYFVVTEEGKSGVGSVAGQRAFCLARSKYVRSGALILYGKGWHMPEESGWRWTERRFAIRIESSCLASVDQIYMSVHIPEVVLDRFGEVTVRAIANGVSLPEERYTEPGQHEYRRKLPAPTGESDVRIDFSIDRALEPDAADARERGIIVRSIEAVG